MKNLNSVPEYIFAFKVQLQLLRLLNKMVDLESECVWVGCGSKILIFWSIQIWNVGWDMTCSNLFLSPFNYSDIDNWLNVTYSYAALT